MRSKQCGITGLCIYIIFLIPTIQNLLSPTNGLQTAQAECRESCS